MIKVGNFYRLPFNLQLNLGKLLNQYVIFSYKSIIVTGIVYGKGLMVMFPILTLNCLLLADSII